MNGRAMARKTLHNSNSVLRKQPVKFTSLTIPGIECHFCGAELIGDTQRMGE